MNGPRLVLVTRRFWPLVGGAEMVMANLSCELRRQGATAQIVTAQWEADWPTELVHREAPVTRLPNPTQRGWGTFRYMTALGRWLRKNRPNIDLVCVSMLKHDAYTALGVMRGAGVPVVLRAEGGGAGGDCHWQRSARFGSRIKRRCLSADALVAPSEAIEAELLEAGYPRQRVHYIANGVAVGPRRDASQRRLSRVALAEANQDLQVHEQASVVVYTGRLHRAKGLFDLVEAWRHVVARRPAAKLWLIGEGPDRDLLYERIVDRGLHHQVALPGAFDQIDEVLQAADVFVLPSFSEGMSMSLLEAMAAEVPVVATDIPGNRKLVTSNESGLLVPPGNVPALAEAINFLLDHAARAAQLASVAYDRVQAEFSLERMTGRHLQLFQKLIAERT